MTELPPQPEFFAPLPERESGSERQLFDLDSMTDTEVTVLAEALGWAGYEMSPEGEAAADRLTAVLVGAVVQLAEREPSRGKELICRWANSGNGHQRTTAVDCAVGLAEFDYPFARKLIAYVGGTPSAGISGDSAMFAAAEIRERGNAEQAADLESEASGSFSRLPDGARLTPNGIQIGQP
ncbi:MULTISPECIES: hypothetical protein [Frankia]|jgi:hypothetical protein|uniref:hypothetical protein n=1 Tax=Frankia TaxID=1854 RepID=UPI001041A0A8|nr:MULTISPECIES: hypothetical protein [Frankia]